MSGEAWLFLLAVLINAVNLFLQVFFTIMYSDLEWCVNLVHPGNGVFDPVQSMRSSMRIVLRIMYRVLTAVIVTISIPSTSATALTPTSFLRQLFMDS